MRVAVIVVSMLVVTTPSEASKSCMSKTEARQHFGSVHIYWHGADHCWDATPTRPQRKIHNPKIRNAQHKNEPKWQNALSEMLPDEKSVRSPWVDRWVDVEPSPLPLVARWVDIVQIAPTPAVDRKPEPLITLRSMVWLVFIAIILALVTIEVLFRCTIYERPKSTTNF
jgi:hypothetical protein